MSRLPLRIQMLGSLQLHLPERSVSHFRYQKAGALLAYLAFYPEHSHPRERLLDLLWPDQPPEAARHNLSNLLACLRPLLEPVGTPSGTLLLADRMNVGVRKEALTTDVAEFEVQLQAARCADSPAEQQECLIAALALYTGELLPGLYAEWVLRERARLERRW